MKCKYNSAVRYMGPTRSGCDHLAARSEVRVTAFDSAPFDRDALTPDGRAFRSGASSVGRSRLQNIRVPGASCRVAAIMRLRLLMAFAAAFVFTASMPLHAADEFIDLPHILEKLPPIESATLILVDPESRFRTALSEAKLRMFGCKFYTQEKLQIESLVSLVAKSNFRIASQREWPLSYWEGLFLTLEDKSELKLLLGRQAWRISGELTLPGGAKAQEVSLAGSFLSQLYEWAGRAESTQAQVTIDWRRQGCNGFTHLRFGDRQGK